MDSLDNSQKKKSYLIDSGRVNNIYFQRNITLLPFCPLPMCQLIGQDLLYDDFSFYQENGDLLFSIPKTQPSRHQ
ncbi:MAG: hypothetical protein R2788_26315 [Saprospiraceae bacterium]